MPEEDTNSKTARGEFPFYIDPKLKIKLDLMIERLEKQDSWVIIDGDEGSGKSGMATFILYYVHWMTGRKFGIENFFYDANSLREECQRTERGLYNWDEAAMGGMSTQWWDRQQLYLTQFAMTGRVKHHFIVFCIPKFYKLQEYFVKERSVALISCYIKRKRYRYLYFNKKAKEKLYDTWKRKKKVAYHRINRDFFGFGGTTPYIFDKIFTLEEQQAYDKRKMDMINSIGSPKDEKKEKEAKLNRFKSKLANLPNKFPSISMSDLAHYLKMHKGTLYEWQKAFPPEEYE